MWLPVKGWPGYEVSSDGFVRQRGTKKPIARSIGTNGYFHVRLKKRRGRFHSLDLHVLVCKAFRGRRPTCLHNVAHHDGNKLNCSARNLRWKTPKQNKADELRHGTRVRGERHGMTKLREGQVLTIRALKGKMHQALLGKIFDVTASAVSDIQRGRTWAWLK